MQIFIDKLVNDEFRWGEKVATSNQSSQNLIENNKSLKIIQNAIQKLTG
jgi:hypothetical protein